MGRKCYDGILSGGGLPGRRLGARGAFGARSLFAGVVGWASRVSDGLDGSQMHAEPNHCLGGGTDDRPQHAWPKDSPPFLESCAVMVVLLVTKY